MTMNMNNRNNRAIIFKDQEHEAFYMNGVQRCKCQDANHKALIYCLGISGDTRQCVERIYDFDNDSVKTECLGEGWITSGSARIVRMAFNLFCNGTPSAYDLEGEEKVRECQRYTVEDLFCCEYAVYFFGGSQGTLSGILLPGRFISIWNVKLDKHHTQEDILYAGKGIKDL